MLLGNRYKSLFINIIAVGIMSMVLSCGHTVKDHKPSIAVSILPQKYFLEKIVGDKYNVTCLLSQGSNPEAFEPNAAHLVNLETSDAYFKIGNIGFELAISNRIRKNNPDLKVFDNSQGVSLITGSHDLGHHHMSHEGHSHEVDPHIWSSAKNAAIIAKNMYEAVVELDSKHKKYYTDNYNKLLKEINDLDQCLDSILTPVKGRSFLVWHPSLSYFANDYQLKQISLESIGKETSIKGYKLKLDKAMSDSITAFLFQREFDSRQAEAIGADLGVKLVVINPMNYNWADEMLATAYAIAGE